MKKRIFALILTAISLLGGASAEFYTSNEDVYFHAKTDCVAGSTFEISEEAAIQFEKLACPVCVERESVKGNLIEIDLPEGYASLKNVDFKDGKLLVCGFVDLENMKPWMAMYDIQGNKLQEHLGEATRDIIRDAKFLSDGKIAIIRSLDGINGKWYVQLIENGKLVHQSEGVYDLFRLWPADDGFFVYGSPQMYHYQLAKCDNDGNILWAMEMDMFPQSDGQPGLDGILVNEDVNIAYGSKSVSDIENRPVIAAFDKDGNVLEQYEVSEVQGLRKAVWAEDGVIFTGASVKPGFAVKFGAEGEIWHEDFGYLCDEYQEINLNGKLAASGWIEDMIPWQDGYLLAMGAYAQSEITYATEKSYIRMAQMNAEGKIIRDWFEEIGDILYTEAVSLMQDGEDVHLMVYGQTMDDMLAYEKGMTQPQIPRKMILKKIAT